MGGRDVKAKRIARRGTKGRKLVSVTLTRLLEVGSLMDFYEFPDDQFPYIQWACQETLLRQLRSLFKQQPLKPPPDKITLTAYDRRAPGRRDLRVGRSAFFNRSLTAEDRLSHWRFSFLTERWVGRTIYIECRTE